MSNVLQRVQLRERRAGPVDTIHNHRNTLAQEVMVIIHLVLAIFVAYLKDISIDLFCTFLSLAKYIVTCSAF